MGSVLFELTAIICLAAFLAIVFRFLKQPAILAYILTGIIVGPFGQIQFLHLDQLDNLAKLGITLLLFIMGLEFKFKDLRSIGLTAGIVGIGQIIITSALGYALAIMLGFAHIASLYIAIALTFSSTIIIVKLLSDKKDLNSLYGKISVGLLLVQDFCAVFILMLLTSLDSGSGSVLSPLTVVFIILKAIGLFAGVIYLSKTVFPHVLNFVAKGEETLFLFSLAWVLGFAGLISSPIIGFPIEIGGFMAGLALANSIENLQIAARIRALRDFFVTIFFVMVGLHMTFGNMSSILLPAILLSLFVLVIKPLIVMGLTGVLGYRKRTSFLAGIITSQTSEFSLIIVFLGVTLNHVSSEIVSLLAVISVITFTVSTYLIVHSNKAYLKYGKYLSFLEGKIRKDTHVEAHNDLGVLKNHVVLVGSNRMGESILDALKEEGEEVLVIDFDPDVVQRLKKKNTSSLFGDIADLDIQEFAQLESAKLVISTIPDIDDNLVMLKNLKSKKTKIVVMAQEIEDAKKLYGAGADYVILPHLAGGRHLAKIIKDDTLGKLESFKSRDAKYLK